MGMINIFLDMFLVIILIEQQMAAEVWKALISASERSSPPLASWQHVPHILLHVVICCVHTYNSMKTKHPTLVCLLATCSTHPHTNCVLIQYNSIENKAPTYLVDCPTQLICTWIFICWVGGGFSRQWGVNCLSPYFKQEWAFWQS